MKIEDLKVFDISEHIKTDEDIIEYLKLVLEDNDKDELEQGLRVIAKSRGIDL